jgi:hypothetical protein
VPILLIFNLKQDQLKIPGARPLLPFDAKAMDAVDAENPLGLQAGDLITPDVVQGKHATLREAGRGGRLAHAEGARGKLMLADGREPGGRSRSTAGTARASKAG